MIHEWLTRMQRVWATAPLLRDTYYKKLVISMIARFERMFVERTGSYLR